MCYVNMMGHSRTVAKGVALATPLLLHPNKLLESAHKKYWTWRPLPNARDCFSVVFFTLLIIMASKPKTSVTAQEIPEDPQQSTAISFPKRAFGKKGDVLRSFQSDWLKNGLFYTTMKPNMLYFAIPLWLLQNGGFCL